jgi:dTDP-4-dehydrorhamnose 3,5-epimerase-like enzyme
MKNTSISDCKVIDIPKISDSRGNLSFVEGGVIPFDLKRMYYLYDIPGGAQRGGHAHKGLHQIIIAISGSFDVTIDDGSGIKVVHLRSASKGLYLCPMIWRTIDNFSSGSVCLVAASEKYDEADYIREYNLFKELKAD